MKYCIFIILIKFSFAQVAYEIKGLHCVYTEDDGKPLDIVLDFIKTNHQTYALVHNRIIGQVESEIKDLEDEYVLNVRTPYVQIPLFSDQFKSFQKEVISETTERKADIFIVERSESRIYNEIVYYVDKIEEELNADVVKTTRVKYIIESTPSRLLLEFHQSNPFDKKIFNCTLKN